MNESVEEEIDEKVFVSKSGSKKGYNTNYMPTMKSQLEKFHDNSKKKSRQPDSLALGLPLKSAKSMV